MRVDLAAQVHVRKTSCICHNAIPPYHITQVLSESVSKALKLTNKTSTEETSKFIEYMDKFFDTLNVSNFTSGKTSRKPFQNPYRSDKDFRITVSINSTQ